MRFYQLFQDRKWFIKSFKRLVDAFLVKKLKKKKEKPNFAKPEGACASIIYVDYMFFYTLSQSHLFP